MLLCVHSTSMLRMTCCTESFEKDFSRSVAWALGGRCTRPLRLLELQYSISSVFSGEAAVLPCLLPMKMIADDCVRMPSSLDGENDGEIPSLVFCTCSRVHVLCNLRCQRGACPHLSPSWQQLS